MEHWKYSETKLFHFNFFLYTQSCVPTEMNAEKIYILIIKVMVNIYCVL